MSSTSFSFTIIPLSGSPSPLSYAFTVTDYVAPFLRNQTPSANETGVDGTDVQISLDVLDDISEVNINTIDAYVGGIKVFQGPSTFFSPWNGPSSAISFTSVDGYDGYHLVLDSINLLPAKTEYTVRVVARDMNNNFMDQSWSFRTGTDLAAIVAGTYEVDLLLTFGDTMADNPDYTNPANYVFSNGMYARYAEKIDNRNIRLWVELFHSNSEFELEVDSSVIDQYGDPLPSSYNSITFSPFQSEAHISNYNGLIRSWRDSALITADNERIYVAGAKGIDVFRKENPSSPVRWGQVLDAYGVMSMFVANFPNDLQITDTTAPYLSGQNPEPNDTGLPGTNVVFAVEDLTTSVEPTSLTIYIDTVLAFRGGYGGWTNGHTGSIAISHKQLDVDISPPTSFVGGDVVTVRVIAEDLLGNRLDETYQFSVASIGLSGGWGGSAWGSSSWGGV